MMKIKFYGSLILRLKRIILLFQIITKIYWTYFCDNNNGFIFPGRGTFPEGNDTTARPQAPEGRPGALQGPHRGAHEARSHTRVGRAARQRRHSPPSKQSDCSVGDLGSIPWRRKWQSTPVLLLGEFHWWRSLEGIGMRLQRIRHDWATNTFTLQTPHYSRANCTHIHTHSFILRIWLTWLWALTSLEFVGQVENSGKSFDVVVLNLKSVD